MIRNLNHSTHFSKNRYPATATQGIAPPKPQEPRRMCCMVIRNSSQFSPTPKLIFCVSLRMFVIDFAVWLIPSRGKTAQGSLPKFCIRRPYKHSHTHFVRFLNCCFYGYMLNF